MADKVPLKLDPTRVYQPLSTINPTRAYFDHVDIDGHNKIVETPGIMDIGKLSQRASSIAYKWTSRNNRKGRHAVVVKPGDAATAAYEVPPFTNTISETAKGVWRMYTYYPVWDISWLVAFIFTIGSAIWVVNACFIFFSMLMSGLSEKKYVLYGEGISACIGASVFQIGSVLLLIEAVNADKSGCFGWALYTLINEENEEDTIVRAIPGKQSCTHHHRNKTSLVRKPKSSIVDSKITQPLNVEDNDDSSISWTWWPTEEELQRRYLHDLGFQASVLQLIGSTIYCVSGITALPGIFNHLLHSAVVWSYWVPQIIGSCFFIVSSILFMLETQKHWWLPAPGTLGWHIAVWNLIGGIGFGLCACFGLNPAGWSQIQSGCTTF